MNLLDGSGSGADKTGDVPVTSTDQIRIGDGVLARGMVRNDKDFGSGYKVPVEDAWLSR